MHTVFDSIILVPVPLLADTLQAFYSYLGTAFQAFVLMLTHSTSTYSYRFQYATFRETDTLYELWYKVLWSQ